MREREAKKGEEMKARREEDGGIGANEGTERERKKGRFVTEKEVCKKWMIQRERHDISIICKRTKG